MPIAIEQSYLDQGCRLPGGITWDMVAERRVRWDISAIFVPLALAPGCVGWGVSYVDGVPLGHP